MSELDVFSANVKEILQKNGMNSYSNLIFYQCFLITVALTIYPQIFGIVSLLEAIYLWSEWNNYQLLLHRNKFYVYFCYVCIVSENYL